MPSLSSYLRLAGCVLVVSALASCVPSSPVPSDSSSIIVGVDDAVAPLAEGLLNAYDSSRLGITVTMEQAGQQITLASLSNGDIDAALFLFTEGSVGFTTPIAQEIIIFITHLENEFEGLSQDEARSLVTGSAGNWTQVGGPELPVTVIGTEPEGSVRLALDQVLLHGAPQTPSARLVTDYAALQQLVAEIPGAIGYIPHSALERGVRPLTLDGVPPTLEAAQRQSYPLTVQIVFVAREEPQGQLRQFLDWILSSPGQQVVRRHMLGFND